MKVNIYDFDGTIYDGDSSVDFYKYCLKKKKKMYKYFPKMIWYLFLYILSIKTKTEMKEVFFSFLKEFDNTEELVEDFWIKNQNKIKKWYKEKNHSNDIIISASPQFLLDNMCRKLKVKDVISSNVDIKTGKFIGLNCYGEEKVKRLLDKYPDVKIKEMYTDSTSDIPLINLASESFIVNKNNIINYKDYKPSIIKKFKHTFLNPKFIRFVFVGFINTFNRVLFSFLYSNVISNEKLSFVIGYITSLIISYILNSFITFHDKNLNVKKFIKFCISYIPNFLIQLICVYIFIDLLHLYKLIAYTVSAIIGIPITYLALLLFTFNKNRK